MELYITVIIPTYNRSGLLEETLRSIAAQTFSQENYEVIVVDNGSTDNTAEICRQFSSQIKHLVYVFDDIPGQLTGRHRGLRESGSELLAYIDDDVILGDSWLTSIWNLAGAYPEIPIFGGPSLPEYHGVQPEWLPRLFEDTPYGGKMCLPLSLIDLEKEIAFVDPVYVFGLNFVIRKAVLESLKGFHPDVIPASLQQFQGDGETGLSIKAGMQNFKAIHSSALSIKHQIPEERLTQEFFNKWSYYNGVCKSYTELRYRFNLYKPSSEPAPFAGPAEKVKRLLKAFSKIWQSRPVDKWADLSRQLTENYQAGYRFHQHAFSQDPVVKEWVLKKDYLNYELPALSSRDHAL